MAASHGVDLLTDALRFGFPEICNADQGSQFTGGLWIGAWQTHNIKISHDGVGRCIDHIRIERLWRTIKYEDILMRSYDSLTEARTGIFNFIEHYNYGRSHQALGYKTPAMLYFQARPGERMTG